MYTLLANIHDPENWFQKLNEIHKRRPNHWNWHTDSHLLPDPITVTSRPYLWSTMLPMIHWQIELFHGYLSNSAGQSTEAIHSVAKWSLSDRFMSNPDCIFCHWDGCKKVKKAHYWTIKPLSKFEFDGEETVIKTAESKNKIMMSFYGSRDRTFMIGKQSSTKVVWNGTQQIQKKILVQWGCR